MNHISKSSQITALEKDIIQLLSILQKDWFVRISRWWNKARLVQFIGYLCGYKLEIRWIMKVSIKSQ